MSRGVIEDIMMDLEDKFPTLMRTCSLIPGLRAEVVKLAKLAVEEDRERRGDDVEEAEKYWKDIIGRHHESNVLRHSIEVGWCTVCKENKVW